jgi:hypothetical protein
MLGRITWKLLCLNLSSPSCGAFFTNKLTTNSVEKTLSEDDSHSVKFPDIYGTRKFSTMFTRVHHWHLWRGRWNQPTSSHTVSFRYILILSSHVCLWLRSDPFPASLARKFVYEYLIPPMGVTCSGCLFYCHFITLIKFGEE